MSIDTFFGRLADRKEAPAILCNDRVWSYSDLLERVEWWSRYLIKRGITQPQSVAVVGDYSPETAALLLALMRDGHVAVPLSTTGAQSQEEMFSVACVNTSVHFHENDEWEVRCYPRRAAHPLVRTLSSAGLVVFTTGSTGKSKAALHDCQRLLEKFEVPRAALRTLLFLRLDHLGGLNTLLHVLSNGGAAVMIRERTPDAVCQAIAQHRVQLLPTSPTFLKMLLMSRTEGRHDLSSLQMITFGTEPMPLAILRALQARFPSVRVKQTYGLTETGALPAQARGDGTLWLKLTGEATEVKVQNGTLWLRCRSAMLGYLNASNPFDADGWFDTQDAVEVEGEYMRILGRRTDVINVGGHKVFPATVEDVLLEMENVGDAEVYGRPSPVTGQVVAARLAMRAPESLQDLQARVRAFCAGRLRPYEVPFWLELVDGPRFDARFKRSRRA